MPKVGHTPRQKMYVAVLVFAILIASIVASANAAGVSKSVVKNEMSDKVISDAIIAQYTVNKNAKGLNISVIVQKGLVTLVGNVPTDEIREELEEIAKNTNGVREVISKFVVNTPQENNLITTKKIKSNLLNEKTIKYLDIRVETDDGVVTLIGEVPSDNIKELIETIVKNTEGVKDINSNLEVNSNLKMK